MFHMKQLRKFINRVNAEYDHLGGAAMGPLAVGIILGAGVITTVVVTADSIDNYNLRVITLGQMAVKIALVTTVSLTSMACAYVVGGSIIKDARQKEKAQEEEETSAI